MNQRTLINISLFKKNWGWFLLWGTLLMVLGIVAIGASTMTSMVTMIFLGFLILIGSIIVLIDTFIFWWKKWQGFFLHLIMGLLYFIVGIFLIRNPLASAMTVTLFLGIFYIIVGLYRIFYSSSVRTPQWGWVLFNGVISLLLGILITIGWPASGMFIIGLFIGIDLLFAGWTYVMMALGARFVKEKEFTTVKQ